MPRYLVPTVNTQKITSQLTKEIKRNPAKAAVLGGLLVVAIWFWYPLIQKWTGGSSKSVAKQQSTVTPVIPSANPNDIVLPTAAPASVSKTAIDWRTIAQKISDDPWMKSGTLQSSSFDPFYPEQAQATVLTSTESEPTPTTEVDVAPDSVGLAVTSVIVGGRKPLARINNQNYHVGDTIRVADIQIEYTLLDVHPWGVQLKTKQQVYELHLDETPQKNNRRFILRNGNLVSQDN